MWGEEGGDVEDGSTSRGPGHAHLTSAETPAREGGPWRICRASRCGAARPAARELSTPPAPARSAVLRVTDAAPRGPQPGLAQRVRAPPWRCRFVLSAAPTAPPCAHMAPMAAQRAGPSRCPAAPRPPRRRVSPLPRSPRDRQGLLPRLPLRPRPASGVCGASCGFTFCVQPGLSVQGLRGHQRSHSLHSLASPPC